MKKYLKDYTEQVYEETQKIIDKFGPRLAGDQASLDTADHILDSFKKISDQSEKEDFYIHQGAFLGWIKILVFNYALAIIFMWLNLAFISVILLVLSLVILVLQFFLYKPLLDMFYPKRKASNVIGIIEPKKEVKQQIIVSGHHDSARIFNFLTHQPKLYSFRVTGSIALIIIMVVVNLLILIFSQLEAFNLYLSIFFTFTFLLVGQMWFFASKKGTPGAGDNLVASMVAMMVGKHFKEVEHLNHTRVIMLSFDAEEEGLRGARAYVKKHKEQLKEIPTYLLNSDCLYDEKELFFLTSDLNDFVKYDEDFIDELLEVSEVAGRFVFKQPISFLTGGTDAAEFAKEGIKATTLIGMPWTNDNRMNSYHTPDDTLEHVNFNVVVYALDIFISYIKYKDKEVGIKK
ncbi:M28 family metallopeptidase [Mariniplasma anaerobium]|uniref:Aminopeptidase n=1 Tax=Mariniplasma anaerobium TaxID=2735436 RepID=A0A7U9XW89_9MOLU|nr:M28 family peptidase [Mariniplasma anaerobium]BCR36269.1 aminopeptidase [Mariniplasma anaerobium]